MRQESTKETRKTNSTTGPSRSFTKQGHEISIRTRRQRTDDIRYASAHYVLVLGYCTLEAKVRGTFGGERNSVFL